MYFQKFPQTLYSLDDRATVQVVTNITLRNVISDEVKTNYGTFELYDIRDGETPEILAYQFYGDSNLHWIILHMNDIIDPRFDWPLDTYSLQKYVEGKYANVNGVHHYENASGDTVSANVIVNLDLNIGLFSVRDVLVNETNLGVGYIQESASVSNVILRVTSGGFQAGDTLYLASNSQLRANVVSTIILSGIPVTNYNYEDEVNESKRRIKILKPQYVERVNKEFDSKFEQVNG